MADIIDQGNEAAELFLQASLSRIKPVTHTGIGLCLYCGSELFDDERRWCDAHCRDEWEANRA